MERGSWEWISHSSDFKNRSLGEIQGPKPLPLDPATVYGWGVVNAARFWDFYFKLGVLVLVTYLIIGRKIM